MRRRWIAGLLVAAALFLPRPAGAAEMLIVSDIHFNPFADRALVDRLAAAPVEQWATILSSDDSRMSFFGEDTNWKLLASALAAMKAQPPDLVLVPGDFLVHRLGDLYDASASDHSDAAFQTFAAKTIAFLALELKSTFPGKPILPALGNNDSDCGDYALRPGGRFLADTLAAAQAMVGPERAQTIRQTWLALGNYAVPNPLFPDQLVVIVNTNFLSRDYHNRCGRDADGNPARATLAWLDRTLAQAAAAHRKVWLVYHIPPGIDAFATARRGSSCPISPVPMFAASADAEFHALMKRYRGTVSASFAGHTHMDGFRLLGDHGSNFGFVMMTPALSPIAGQDPAFRRVTLSADGQIADTSVYNLANFGTAATGGIAHWSAEADFAAEWRLPRFDLPSLENLFARLGASKEAEGNWLDDYAVHGPARLLIGGSASAVYRCAAGNDEGADFAACACAHGDN